MENDIKEALAMLNISKQLTLRQAQVASENEDVQLHSEYTERLRTLSELTQLISDRRDSWLEAQENGDNEVASLYFGLLHYDIPRIKDWFVSQNVAKLSS